MVNFINQYNIPNDKPIILATGRLTRWKGQHLLIKALSKTKNRSFHCILLGDAQGRSKYVAYIKNLIQKYDMVGNFTFVTHVEDVPAMMMLSSIVTSTALEPEAFGRMTIEGQAMGKIVLASNIGGSLDNTIDGVTGKLFESNNVVALAETLDWALDLSEKEKAKIAKNARENVKDKFTKEIMCDKTIEVYKEVLKQKLLF